jgi:D-amino-acid dehydrogenase
MFDLRVGTFGRTRVRVIVLGAGVIGVATAWYLREAGHEVTLVDRQAGPGLETSFANGGQLSVTHAEPWANPGAVRQILQWLVRRDSPLVMRPRADWRQWRWAASFLFECLPQRSLANARAILALALDSAAALAALRSETGIAYDHLARGILSFYLERSDFEHAAIAAEQLRPYGCIREVKTAAECVAIEPALEHARSRLAGGIFAPHDASGDAHLFTARLAVLCAQRGVRLRLGETVELIEVEGGKVARVRVASAERGDMRITADAYVVAMGSYSAPLTHSLGIRLPVYPVKGYSVTLPAASGAGAPTVSLTDEGEKLVFSRLGERLRVAGTAELTGYDTAIDDARCERILARVFDLFPAAGERMLAEFWSGLRPATPGNVPLIGRTRYGNLFLNTGHGTLGWTLACGSGRALAAIVSGRDPGIAFPFLQTK